MTELEAKLLGTAAAAHEAITDLKAGRVEQAIENLQKSTPTLERINEHADRRVAFSLANPDGMLGPQIKQPVRKQEFDVSELDANLGSSFSIHLAILIVNSQAAENYADRATLFRYVLMRCLLSMSI